MSPDPLQNTIETDENSDKKLEINSSSNMEETNDDDNANAANNNKNNNSDHRSHLLNNNSTDSDIVNASTGTHTRARGAKHGATTINTKTITTNNQATTTSSTEEQQPHQNVVKHKVGIIALLASYYFLSSSYYSLFAPFLPTEAVKKGLSQFQVGIIFGSYEFVVLVLSPFFGKYLNVFGIRFLFLSGLFLSSGSEMLFGLLDRCPPGTIYFIMSCACRCVTGLGISMGLSYAIVGHIFPKRVSSIVALLQIFNGLGLMIGPLIGGVLYELGGFPLPFYFMGGLLAGMFCLSYFLFPDFSISGPPTTTTTTTTANRELQQQQQVDAGNYGGGRTMSVTSVSALSASSHTSILLDLAATTAQATITTTTSKKTAGTLKMWPLIRTPKFTIAALMLFCGSLSIGFIQPSIQIHLEPLELRPIELGSILFFPALCYAVTTPIVGYFCDRFAYFKANCMYFSGLVSAISFSFFGPIPWINLPLRIWIFLPALICFGLALGGLTIPVYSHLLQIAYAKGYPKDLRTQGLISGVFSSLWSLGALVGPIFAGTLVDLYGFNKASLSIVGLVMLTNTLFAITHLYDHFYNQQTPEEARLPVSQLVVEESNDEELLEA